MFKNKLGADSPIPKFIHLKIRRRDGVESLTNLEEGEFKVPIEGYISGKKYVPDTNETVMIMIIIVVLIMIITLTMIITTLYNNNNKDYTKNDTDMLSYSLTTMMCFFGKSMVWFFGLYC